MWIFYLRPIFERVIFFTQPLCNSVASQLHNTLVPHHLPSVGTKQLCAQANLGCTCVAGIFLYLTKITLHSLISDFPIRIELLEKYIQVVTFVYLAHLSAREFQDIIALCNVSHFFCDEKGYETLCSLCRK